MGLEEVREDIIEEAEKEAEGVISKAEEEAEEIRSEAERKAEKIEADYDAEIEKEKSKILRKKESDARLENKRKKTEAKGKLIEKVEDKLQELVDDLSADEEGQLVRNALDSLKERTDLEKVVVSEKVAEEISDDFDLEVSEGDVRGLLAEEKDRDVVHNLSFEKIVAETFENNVNKVSDKVFK